MLVYSGGNVTSPTFLTIKEFRECGVVGVKLSRKTGVYSVISLSWRRTKALHKEHASFGIFPGIPVYVVLFFLAFRFGLFSGLSMTVATFAVGLSALLIGSILPDLESPRSPVHDTFLVLLGAFVTVFMQNAGFPVLALLIALPLKVWADRNYPPSH